MLATATAVLRPLEHGLDAAIDHALDHALTDMAAKRSAGRGTGRLTGFGARLAALRQGRGMTQTELGDAAGVSQRVIAYYETESTQPPGALLVDLARALRCTTDELLGAKPTTETLSPRTARLLKRLQRIEELPAADQRAVLKLVDAMLETRRRSAPTARQRPKRKAG